MTHVVSKTTLKRGEDRVSSEERLSSIDKLETLPHIIPAHSTDELPSEPVQSLSYCRDIEYQKSRKTPFLPSLFNRFRLLTGAEPDHVTTAYNMLRTRLLQTLNDANYSSIAFLSPTANDGKTLTAVNLCISLSREVNHTVLLVDADLKNPSVHQYFDFTPEAGLDDYLTNDEEIENVLVNPSIPGLVLLPIRRKLANSSEFLSSPKMTVLSDELKNRYQSRIIVYDFPPLLACDDALAFLPNVDACVLILEEGKSTKVELRESVKLLRHHNLIGTIINKSKTVNSLGY